VRYLKPYKTFESQLLLEKYDAHLKQELGKLGLPEEEIRKEVYLSKRGNLAQYLNSNGGKFTFGMLHAIFLDSLEAKKRTDIKTGAYKMIWRLIPLAIAPFFPMLAILGYVFGSTRAINKLLKPIFEDPSTNYEGFLMKIINASIKISEGEISLKDRFSRAFVVSDKLTNALKPEVLYKFMYDLSIEMKQEDMDKEVPEHYINNKLKEYINTNYNIDPPMELK